MNFSDEAYTEARDHMLAMRRAFLKSRSNAAWARLDEAILEFYRIADARVAASVQLNPI
jgi:hypothetical protein